MIKKLFNHYYLILIAIVAVAAIARFAYIETIPPSLTWDEVAWGYNAYSLGIDGTDEYGRFLPITHLESFGDYKPPLYAYLDVVPIKIFGLSSLGVRFPSAFFGTLTVLVTFFLTKEIFFKSKKREWYALVTASVLAVSHWHIMLSRAAFEANVASFFIVTGVWLFLIAVRRSSWLLLFSVIAFVLSMYTFNSARIVAPLLGAFLATVFYKDLLKAKLPTLSAAFIGLILLLPLIQFLLSPQAQTRFHEVNIFSDLQVIEDSNQQIANDSNSLFSRVLHNRRLMYGASYLSHYLDHFGPEYLFIKGDENPKFSTRQMGQLYLWSLPFLLVGALLLFRKKESLYYIVPIWLLLGIIPAATARETPHALRTEAIIPTVQILIAYGLVNSICYIRNKVKTNILKNAIIFGTVLVIFASVLYFQNYYTNHYAREYSRDWQYGYSETFSYLSRVENNYDRIYMTDLLGRPYIYYLYSNNISPEDFRSDNQIDRDVFGLVDVRRVGKYYFNRQIHDLPTDDKKILFVNVPDRVPENANIVEIIRTLNGEEQLIIYTSENE